MFPYEIKPIVGPVGEELLRKFKGKRLPYVEVGPKKWILTGDYAEHADNFYNFEVKPDDLWIVTFPRSGTTWMQELLWLVNNDLDYETGSKIPLFDRFPFFEFNVAVGKKFTEEIAELNGFTPEVMEALKSRNTPGYEIVGNLKSPRHIKTHLPPSLLPSNLLDICKVVYVIRNPYDVAVSYFHHNQTIKAHDFQGNFEQYWNLFEKNLIFCTPYWEHIKEGWTLRNHPNCLLLFYEDLLKDLPSNLKKIGKFLNKQMSDEQIAKLADHLHIDNFRKNVTTSKKVKLEGMMNPNSQSLIRRGKTGGNEEFTDANLKSRADKWFKENLAKTDIEFPEYVLEEFLGNEKNA